MSKSLRYYCGRFSQLRVDRTRGIAPHKPILLLSIIDLIEQGLLRENRIFLSPELIATFLKFWNQLGSDGHRADIALPFFHLRGDEFWHFKANPGYEEAIASRQVRLKSIKALREAIQYAYIDDELFEHLQAPQSRLSLVSALTTAWFSDNADSIQRLWQIDALQDLENQLRQRGGATYQPEDLKDEARTVVRDAAFRRVIVSIYEHRCAFCGLQMIDAFAQNIVDGAHVKPFAIFYDDRIDNGISLCKNHHWAFDRGWFSIEDDYTLLISNDLREESPNAIPMRKFQGQPIHLPALEQYHPRLEALRWHRENVFKGPRIA